MKNFEDLTEEEQSIIEEMDMELESIMNYIRSLSKENKDAFVTVLQDKLKWEL